MGGAAGPLGVDLLILDLDGTLRHCPRSRWPFPNRLGEQDLLPGAAEAVAAYLAAGAALAVATNQGGIGLGLMAAATHDAIVEELRKMLAKATGQPIQWRVYTCPHSPGEGCGCRKPRPAMLRQAMADAGAAGHRTLFVGDQDSDRAAADAAGCRYQDAAEWRRG